MNEIPPNDVGRRLREIRAWRGQSLEVVAGLAGLSYGYLGRLERGEQPLTNRGTLEAIARALKVSPSEFNGQPWETTDAQGAEAYAELIAVENALEICELGSDPGTEIREWSDIAADLAALEIVRESTDYAAACALAPGLLTELHSAYVRRPQWRREVLVGIIRCYYALAQTTKRLGVRGLPIMIVKAAYACAQELESPAWIGFAVWLRGSISGSLSRSQQYTRAVRTADGLIPHLDDSSALQAYGMLHLSAALAGAVQSDRDTANTHLAEAEAVAARMDEEVGSFGRLWFGRTNVGIWRSSIGMELGDGVQAVELTRSMPIDSIPSPSRRANYYAEAGRTLLAEPKYRETGLALLMRAEDIAPQQVRTDFFVREAIADQLRSARRDAGGRNLRGMAWRLGIAPESSPNN
jgi:transcriptional regulator with XRE-family HTH domain